MPDASPDADEPLHGGYTRFELELEVTVVLRGFLMLHFTYYPASSSSHSQTPTT